LYVLITDTSESARDEENVKVKFETLRAMEQAETIDIDSHMSDRVSVLSSVTVKLSVIHWLYFTPDFLLHCSLSLSCLKQL
jgi:hypothetical protein